MGGPGRLVRRRDFLRVQENGKRFKSRSVALLVTDPAGGETRVGLTVSRKVGKAVVRNKVRRRLRELVRRHGDEMCAGCDHVIIAYTPAAEASYDEIEKDLKWLLSQARSWASRRASSPA